MYRLSNNKKSKGSGKGRNYRMKINKESITRKKYTGTITNQRGTTQLKKIYKSKARKTNKKQHTFKEQ